MARNLPKKLKIGTTIKPTGMEKKAIVAAFKHFRKAQIAYNEAGIYLAESYDKQWNSVRDTYPELDNFEIRVVPGTGEVYIVKERGEAL